MKKIKIIFFIFFQIILVAAHAMPIEDTNVKVAKSLFMWNTINLTSHANLKKNEIGNFFAPHFVIKANGIEAKATYDSYFKFLNHFRKDIRTINYEFQDFIVDRNNVVLPLKARIHFNDGSNKVFDAILILKFNKEHKIILWQEVYILKVNRIKS